LTATKVELHQGYWWTCDECGRDVHGNAELDLPAEQVQKMFDESEFEMPDDNEPMQMIYVPNRVKCPHCDAEFETEEP